MCGVCRAALLQLFSLPFCVAENLDEEDIELLEENLGVKLKRVWYLDPCTSSFLCSVTHAYVSQQSPCILIIGQVEVTCI